MTAFVPTRFPGGMLAGLVLLMADIAPAAVLFETDSPYHHISVVEQGDIRTLSFNGSRETQMSVRDPLKGHFGYTEYFQMPWLWNTNITNILFIGLGGASTQRAYLHYYPGVAVETVELDASVVNVAKKYFHVKESPQHRIFNEDGRQYLRRSQKKYDVIILDAYRTTRYGSFMPYHLATREFFEIVRDHLTENGVIAYNVMGSYQGWRADILGAMYRTLRSVFPQVYCFPAKDSMNVVMIATRDANRLTVKDVWSRSTLFMEGRKVNMPGFRVRATECRFDAPPTARASPVLSDDFAPVDGLLSRAK